MSETLRTLLNAKDKDGDDVALLVELLPQDRLLLVAAILGAGDMADGPGAVNEEHGVVRDETSTEWAARIVSRARALLKATA